MTHAIDEERPASELERAVIAAAFPAASRVLTSRTALEDAILLQREQIEQIVHDLMNPLAVVSAVAQSITRRFERAVPFSEARLRDDLVVITEAVSKAVAEINRFMDSARNTSPSAMLEVGSVDFIQTITQAVEDSRRVATTHRLVVVTDYVSMIGPGDEALLLHAFDNLLRNAIKYSPQGGTITVSLAPDAIDRPTHITVVIRDEGIGIPQDALPRIFERFYRADNVVAIEGTGLGLSGALRIVEAHGGDMKVESPEGKGCAVTVRLPLHAIV